MIKPALTPEEWALIPPPDKDGFFGDVYLWNNQRHGLAAACLHNQPFGFTRDDLLLIKLLVGHANTAPTDLPEYMEPQAKSLYERLASFLPQATPW